MLNYAAKLGPRNSYRFFLLRPGQRHAGGDRPRCRSAEPAYMHSFGLTPRWLVLAEFPFVVNPLSLALSGRPYIENFRWQPELGTRFHLFDRSTGQAARTVRDRGARFAFHHVNSYEDGDDVVVDIVHVHRTAQIVEDLYLERLRQGKPVSGRRSERFRITPGTGEVTVERLLDERDRAPAHQLHALQRASVPLRMGRRLRGRAGSIRSSRADVVERTRPCGRRTDASRASRCSCRGPAPSDEDDGVLLSVVLDGRTERSFLLVLDAGSLDELGAGRGPAPHPVRLPRAVREITPGWTPGGGDCRGARSGYRNSGAERDAARSWRRLPGWTPGSAGG